MDCRELEDRLEALLEGELGAAESRRCERHLERCRRCRELVAPFTATAPADGDAAPADLVETVLARTSGPTCGSAHALLCGRLDGELAASDRALVDGHLEGCPDCRRLAAVLTRLEVDLPRMAELEPDARFVADVLSATLPWSVRLRRWWTERWPRWVRRPRFASEAAFVATLALVLVFATPGSPLAAVPGRALELTRAAPSARLEAPVAALGERFATRVEAPLRTRWQHVQATVTSWTVETREQARTVAADARQRLGTTWEAVASLFVRAEENRSTTQEQASDS